MTSEALWTVGEVAILFVFGGAKEILGAFLLFWSFVMGESAIIHFRLALLSLLVQ